MVKNARNVAGTVPSVNIIFHYNKIFYTFKKENFAPKMPELLNTECVLQISKLKKQKRDV